MRSFYIYCAEINRDAKLVDDQPFSHKKCLYYFNFSLIFVGVMIIFATLAMFVMRHLKVSSTENQLHIISRREWIAQPPLYELDKLELPVPKVIIAHTATENCTTQVFARLFSAPFSFNFYTIICI